jgi:pimeloyl-ACP methyl ester carboxylesterase
MATVHHRYASVDGHQLFYRESGPADAPVLVLLHGYPSSSYMFRKLIPVLGERYHVIAPDQLGFGLSDAPALDEFDYTFEALSALTTRLLAQLGVTRFALYVHDYGAPIGWRIAVADPTAVTAIVSQSGNGYQDGFVESFWQPVWDYSHEQTAQTEAAVRQGLTLKGIRWQYVTGVPDVSVLEPEAWYHDLSLVSRPGNDLVQLALNRDYVNNVPFYPRLHEYLRASRVPLLAVWGEGDEIFGPAGARAFAKDSPDAEIHLIPGGHFLLESALHEVAELILPFLDKVHGAG